MVQKYYAYDAEWAMRAMGSAALTADGYLGSQIDQKGNVLTEAVLVMNLEAVKVSAGNELYMIRVMGSQTADRSDARVLASIELGDAAAKAQDTADDVAGDQIVLPFKTERPAGTNHRYIDVHLDVTGTSPSITLGAFISKPM